IVPITIPWKDIRDESVSALVMISIVLLGLHFSPVVGLQTLGAYVVIGAAVYFSTLLTINGKIRDKMRFLGRETIKIVFKPLIR
ncbi:MAG: hypothetical protein WBK88_08220, partial [Methanothrix sp.]